MAIWNVYQVNDAMAIWNVNGSSKYIWLLQQLWLLQLLNKVADLLLNLSKQVMVEALATS